MSLPAGPRAGGEQDAPLRGGAAVNRQTGAGQALAPVRRNAAANRERRDA